MSPRPDEPKAGLLFAPESCKLSGPMKDTGSGKTSAGKTAKGSKDSKNIQNWVLGGILFLLFLLVCRLFSPFFSVILWSTLLYIIISPLYHRAADKLDRTTRKGKFLRTLCAVAFTLGTVLVILVPLGFVGGQLFKQLWELLDGASKMFSENPDTVRELFQRLAGFVSRITGGQILINPEEIVAAVSSRLSSVLQTLFQFSTNVVRNVGSFVGNLAFLIFCLFFFYLDGQSLLRMAKRVVPIRREYMDGLVVKFKEITKSLFLGYVMVGLIQAVVAYIIFLIFKVKGALVFSILIIFFSFVPLLGPVFIWLPVGVVKIISGDLAGGIIFMAVCALTISTLDNILRPLFLKDRVKLHPLIIFFAILGGVTLFGFNGLILGPMVVLLFLTVLDFFLAEHRIDQGELAE